MNRRHRTGHNYLRYAFLGLLLLVWPTAAWAAETTIATGETSESITLFGDDDLVVEAGATVDGHVTLWGGSAEIAGTINGNLFVYGGAAVVDDTAVITGDCVALGGRVEGDCVMIGTGEGAGLAGDVAAGLPGLNAGEMSVLPVFTLSALLLTLAAWGVAQTAPDPLRRVAYAVRTAPFSTGFFGVLTLIAGGVAVALTIALSTALLGWVVGVLGYPIALALLGFLVVAAVVGWLAMGSLVGSLLKIERYATAVTLGTMILLGIAGLAWWWGVLPGVLVTVGIVAAGLGAATITRLGTRGERD